MARSRSQELAPAPAAKPQPAHYQAPATKSLTAVTRQPAHYQAPAPSAKPQLAHYQAPVSALAAQAASARAVLAPRVQRCGFARFAMVRGVYPSIRCWLNRRDLHVPRLQVRMRGGSL